MGGQEIGTGPALPAKIDADNATLPEKYEQAKNALSHVVRVDECKDWADKAKALATYARQAEDTELERMAKRIRARAIRRAGELLRSFQDTTREVSREAAGKFKRDGTVPFEPRTQREAAERAGMSERQEKTAVRVSKIDPETFEKEVESEDPPSVTALGKKGKQKARRELTPEQQRTILLQKSATAVWGGFRYLVERLEGVDPSDAVEGMTAGERSQVQEWAGVIRTVAEDLETRTGGTK